MPNAKAVLRLLVEQSQLHAVVVLDGSEVSASLHELDMQSTGLARSMIFEAYSSLLV